jgi:hypothetical protein
VSQTANLRRVSDNIASYVLEFLRFELMFGTGEFYASDLRGFVQRSVGMIAPESPGRILRELRKQGRVDYEVVSRAGSLYRVTGVRA